VLLDFTFKILDLLVELGENIRAVPRELVPQPAKQQVRVRFTAGWAVT
jgi:hypothetical protein